MPGFVIHIAIAKEYLRKHRDIENEGEFIKGTIYPDLVEDKTKTHYGKSPTYTDLKQYLLQNDFNSSFNKGSFLHLVADYLFYNQYLRNIPRKESKEIIHNDYDIINRILIEKYDISLFEEIKKYIFYKDGQPKILTLDLIERVIEEISNMDLEVIRKEVLKDDKKWKDYKTI